MDPSAPSSNKRKRSNDGSPSDNPRQLSGMENIGGSSEVFTEQNGGHLSPLYISSNKRDRDYPNATLIRRGHALLFKRSVERGKIKNTIEGKTHILPDWCSRRPLLWREDLYGIPRIAVHGSDSICVVTRKEDVLSVRHQVYQGEKIKHIMDVGSMDCWMEYFLLKFRNAVIYEVEELAFPLESFKKPRSCNEHMPFGLVSVNLGTNMVCDKASGHEASSAEYHVDNVIKFLQEAMNSGATFTFNETVKIAISALQHLFGKKFQANEIEVYVLKREEGGGVRKRKRVMTSSGVVELPCCLPFQKKKLNDFEVEEMPIRAERRIKDYVTLIKKQPCSI